MDVSPDEFVSAREAQRGFGLLLDRVEADGKAVIVYRNRPRAVLLSVPEYERLCVSWKVER